MARSDRSWECHEPSVVTGCMRWWQLAVAPALCCHHWQKVLAIGINIKQVSLPVAWGADAWQQHQPSVDISGKWWQLAVASAKCCHQLHEVMAVGNGISQVLSVASAEFSHQLRIVVAVGSSISQVLSPVALEVMAVGNGINQVLLPLTPSKCRISVVSSAANIVQVPRVLHYFTWQSAGRAHSLSVTSHITKE